MNSEDALPLADACREGPVGRDVPGTLFTALARLHQSSGMTPERLGLRVCS